MKGYLMYRVYLDTSVRNNKIIELQKSENTEFTCIEKVEGDFDPIVALSELLLKHNLNPSDISEYTPFLGPGSFTGLKNGITICNVLNWALGKKQISELQMPNYGSEPNIQTSIK